jgi:SAM-dependent methyltransferase
VWLYFQQLTALFDNQPKTMLHVAPESCLVQQLRDRLGATYITADLLDSRVMVQMDITAIPYPDASFDVIYCSHVLEHIPDDRKAMREFRRVLKPDGWAVLTVPITADTTIEDPVIVDPAERLRLFGQADHVRRYGPDYVDRLRDAGFAVTVTCVADLDVDARLYGLTAASGEIYHCIPI